MIGHFKIYTEYKDAANNSGLRFAVDEEQRVLTAEVFNYGECLPPKLEELANTIKRGFKVDFKRSENLK